MTILINKDKTVQTAKNIILKKSGSVGVKVASKPMKLKKLTKKVAKKMMMSVSDGEGVIHHHGEIGCVASPSICPKNREFFITRIRKTIEEASDVFRLCAEGKYVSLVVESNSDISSGGDRETTYNNESASCCETLRQKRAHSDSSKEETVKEEKTLARKKSRNNKEHAAGDRKRRDGTTDVAKNLDNFERGVQKVDVEKWMQQNNILVIQGLKSESNAKTIHPFISFHDCETHVAEPLLRHCTQAHGFRAPTPIQAQCWPILLSKRSTSCSAAGRDVIGIAETGSGKTLAFALPALSSICTGNGCVGDVGPRGKRKRLPKMLVLAPTRELAMQSHTVLSDYGASVNITSIVLYGGVPKHVQAKELTKGYLDCIVATPGRLVDLIHSGCCDLSGLSHLVLDEADRMLDLGFEQDIKFIIGQCTPKSRRSTAMFSATWPAAIQEMAGEYMVDPVRVYVGCEAPVVSNGNGGGNLAVDDSLTANKRVKQYIDVIEDRARENRLLQLLHQYCAEGKNNDLVLVFALYKKEAERLENNLRRKGWNCVSIHGNKTQESRSKALADFKSGKTPLLIATDVVARGLDIPNVMVVINYTFPLTIEDYVHRIGRTGRAGKTGISHTFFQPGDKGHAGELQQVLRQAGQTIPSELMKFGSTIKKKEHKLYGNFGPRNSGPNMKQATKIKFSYSDDED